jgi:uncharacterized protein
VLEKLGMVVNINQINEEDGLEVHHTYAEGEPELRSEDSRLVGRSALDLQATRDGDKVKLVGSVTATVEYDCDRCLKPFSTALNQSFDLSYLPAVRPASLLEEKELGGDDLSTAFYQDEAIDLDDLVREQIELALPMSRLCDQECRGLCPECGANLNEQECDCFVEQVDPRWAALKELKSDN